MNAPVFRARRLETYTAKTFSRCSITFLMSGSPMIFMKVEEKVLLGLPPSRK